MLVDTTITASQFVFHFKFRIHYGAVLQYQQNRNIISLHNYIKLVISNFHSISKLIRLPLTLANQNKLHTLSSPIITQPHANVWACKKLGRELAVLQICAVLISCDSYVLSSLCNGGRNDASVSLLF
jgi:hypothetical protein